MTDYELAHPRGLLVRRFLIEPELMADLLTYYAQKAAGQKTIQLLNLSLVRYALAVSKIGKEIVIKAFSKIPDEKDAEKIQNPGSDVYYIFDN